MLKHSLAVLVALCAIGSSSAFGAGQLGVDQQASTMGPTEVTIERKSSIAVGATENRRFHDIVADAIAIDGLGSTIADLDSAIGRVEITLITHRKMSQYEANDLDAGPRPPVDPFGAGANPGDTFYYHSCSPGGFDKTWKLEFKYDSDSSEYRWVVVSYSANHVKFCAPV